MKLCSSSQFLNGRRRPVCPLASAAFTLVELLVATAVLVLLLVLILQLFNATSSVTGRGNARMDTDAQARALFDRMALDFDRIVKRADVDYYLKGRPAANTQSGNDQIAFYSESAGYYPAGAVGVNTQSPVSLVAYRVNDGSNNAAAQNRLERLGKGLIWNGLSTTNVPASAQPMSFLPVPLASPLPVATPGPSPTPTPAPVATPAWPQAGNMADDPDGDYEYMAPQVFRFEYYYILKGQKDATGTLQPSKLSVTPWDSRIADHTSVAGLRDVAGVGVVIAAIDPKSRVLVTPQQLTDLAKPSGGMIDFVETMAPGDLEAAWQKAVIDSGLPRPAMQAIRVYGRTFLFNPTPL